MKCTGCLQPSNSLLDSPLVVLLNPKLEFLLLANINSAKVKFFPIEFLHTEHSYSRQPLKRQRYKLSQRYHFLLNTSLNHEFSCLLTKLYIYISKFKYYKHLAYVLAHKIRFVCSKMVHHGRWVCCGPCDPSKW